MAGKRFKVNSGKRQRNQVVAGQGKPITRFRPLMVDPPTPPNLPVWQRRVHFTYTVSVGGTVIPCSTLFQSEFGTTNYSTVFIRSIVVYSNQSSTSLKVYPAVPGKGKYLQPLTDTSSARQAVGYTINGEFQGPYQSSDTLTMVASNGQTAYFYVSCMFV